jgi:hypothetical protein
MLPNFTPKNALKYECITCDFKSSKHFDYLRHLQTRKHKMLTNVDTNTPKNENILFSCNCGKEYKYRQSLSLHKNKCYFIKKDEEQEKTDLIKMLIKENSDFKNIILEIVKTVQPNNTTNNTNNNNTTNNFNLQFFLNDTCKDAINLVDFVNSLQVKLKDLEETAVLGYSEGVSRIFINGLNALEINKRPIHCSDAKRETLYIKEHNEWTKEDSDKTHLSQAIKTVGKKNIQQIFEWQKKYPDYNDPSSRDSDRYMKMICNTMSGSTEEEQSKNLDKIIKNITKQVVIDKKPIE